MGTKWANVLDSELSEVWAVWRQNKHDEDGFASRSPKIERAAAAGRQERLQLQRLWNTKKYLEQDSVSLSVSSATDVHTPTCSLNKKRFRTTSCSKLLTCDPDLTRSLVSIWARFLWTILTIPGGWIQASPSTCTGTPSSPRMVIFTCRHWERATRRRRDRSNYNQVTRVRLELTKPKPTSFFLL